MNNEDKDDETRNPDLEPNYTRIGPPAHLPPDIIKQKTTDEEQQEGTPITTLN